MSELFFRISGVGGTSLLAIGTTLMPLKDFSSISGKFIFTTLFKISCFSKEVINSTNSHDLFAINSRDLGLYSHEEIAIGGYSQKLSFGLTTEFGNKIPIFQRIQLLKILIIFRLAFFTHTIKR